MVVIRWKNPCRGGFWRFWDRCRNSFTLIRLTIGLFISRITFAVCCLTYNEHMGYDYTIDTLLAPIFYVVDNFSKYLGKVSVFCTVVGTLQVVFIAYWVGLPYWWERCPYTTVFLVIFGNWILLNLVFHFFMGMRTPPGYPPERIQGAEVASICAKCILPKPQRTHHCSVCDRCVLAMDHHCPFLNNCIGYYNARHFYLFMVYMVSGCLFLIIFGLDLGYSVLWLNDTGGLVPNNDPDLIGHPVRINQSGAIIPIKDFPEYDSVNAPRLHYLPIPQVTEAQRIAAYTAKRNCVKLAAVLCPAVVIALGALSFTHGRNISRGETCIEGYINAKMRKINKQFRNPYDFGRRKNWKLFLGLTQGRTFVRHILFPSRHKPAGDGVLWHTIHNVSSVEDWP